MDKLEKFRLLILSAFVVCVFVECCGPSVALRGIPHVPADSGRLRYQHTDIDSGTTTRISIDHYGNGLGVDGSATVAAVNSEDYNSVILDERHYSVNDHEAFIVNSYLSLANLDDDPALELLVHQTHVPVNGVARTTTVPAGTFIVDTEGGQIVERPVSFLKGLILITHKRRIAEIVIFSALLVLLLYLYERRMKRWKSSSI